MKPILSGMLLAALAGPVVGQIRVVNYNTLDGPTPGVHDNSANMQTIFAGIAAQSVNGIARRPDLIILQEQTNTSAAALAALLNAQFAGASYVASTPSGQPGSSDPRFIDRQAFVYDSSTLAAVTAPVTVSTGGVRPVIRGQFRPVGYSSPDARFYAYGVHLEAGTTTADQSGRAVQTAAMRTNANGLGNAHIIFAGDFNMRTNTEAAWQNLVTGAGDGQAVDPINPSNVAQTWNNNAAFAAIHTQSTRTGSTPDGDQGATGGMDDRLDVQLFTDEFNDGEGLAYIPGSYRAFGNDGLHFNAAINASPTIPQGTAVANALWDASDHLPVVVDYQVPAIADLQQVSSRMTVLRGANAYMDFRVRNLGHPSVASAADELDYSISVTGNGSGDTTGTAAAGSAGSVHRITFDTSVPGDRSAIVTPTALSQGAQPFPNGFTASAVVYEHAKPSLASTQQLTEQLIDFGIRGLGEIVPQEFGTIFNLKGSGTFITSSLDIDAIQSTGATSVLSSNVAGFVGVELEAGSPNGLAFQADFDSSQVGFYEATYDILTSDADLPGEVSYSPLRVIVRGRIALVGDATLNQSVNLDDFTTLAANFGTTNKAWQDGDFTRDGLVNLDDFTLLAAHFGESAADAPRAVPEPAFGLSMMIGFALLRRARRLKTGSMN